MKKNKFKTFFIILLIAAVCVPPAIGLYPIIRGWLFPYEDGGETPGETEIVLPLPSGFRNASFVYDEMTGGTGTRLYTLVFGGNAYKLYADAGEGIISEGAAYVDGADSKLTFKSGDEKIKAAINGGGFNALFEGKNMSFVPAASNSEYVYLSYVGAFAANADGREAMLYIERFFEFFMYCDGTLTKGTYEIYADGSIVFSTENSTFAGTVYKGFTGGGFDLTSTSIAADVPISGGVLKDVAFGYYVPPNGKVFSAYHGMGEYVLNLMKAETFIIYGPDGFAKAFGSISAADGGGRAVYFERNFLNNAARTVEFSYDGDSYTFPSTTPLLPGSGNIDPATGKGSYFSSGQILRFLRAGSESETEEDIGEYSITGTLTDADGNPVVNAGVYVNGKKAAETDADGTFAVSGLRGLKRVHFEKENYIFGFYSVTKNTEAVSARGKYVPAEPVPHLPPAGGLRQVMPSVGVAKPLVILVDFPDYARPRFATAAGIEDGLFNIDDENSLSAYYYKSSFGRLVIDGTVAEWYRAEKMRSEYAGDKAVMTEVLNYHIQNGLDLSEYDADGNGEVDSLFVLWAGALNMNSSVWGGAYRSTWGNSPSAWTRKVSGYIMVPGQTVWKAVPPLRCNTVSITHETGHLLGLNDYYSYDGGDGRMSGGYAYSGGAAEGGLGTMDMMDSNLGDHNAFSKWLLGWLEPTVIEFGDFAELNYEKDVFHIRPITENGDALFVKLKSSDTLYTELLVIEVLNTTNNGKAWGRLTKPVVRILHVDAALPEGGRASPRGFGFMYDNSYSDIKFIAVLEADGLDEILNFHQASSNGKPNYEEKDYFGAGAEITPFSYPNTNSYDGFGNAAVYNGLKIKIDTADASGAVIRLGYAEENVNALKIESVSPAVFVSPSANPARIFAGTSEFIFAFNQNIAFAEGRGAQDIRFMSGNSRVTEGVSAEIDGKNLKIIFADGLAANKDYKIIIQRGVLHALSNIENVNNFNYTANFVTEGGAYVPVTGITFDGGNSTEIYGVGWEFNLFSRVAVNPYNATDKRLTFSSDNDSAAVVDPQTGVITSTGVGEAVVTVRAENGVSAQFFVKVSIPSSSPGGTYRAEMSMGGGTLEFELVLGGEGSYSLKRLAGDFPAADISEGNYYIEGNNVLFEKTSGAEIPAAMISFGGGVSISGAFPSGGGPNAQLSFYKTE
ncbi:MAG: hypothetical protein LBP62_07785 [Clostridiales bacterium]|nr:hypothetical protein [Clostridiales bacterium]